MIWKLLLRVYSNMARASEGPLCSGGLREDDILFCNIILSREYFDLLAFWTEA
jgi:hypothetical protein